MNMPLNIMNKKTLLVLILASVALAGCRGADETDIIDPQFPATNDPDAFIQFLNPRPGVPEVGAVDGEINNVEDFPEAYYNTIDPDRTRNSLLKWQFANGFANEDGTVLACDPPDCVNVKFRDAKDLGYGRDMFMRWNKGTGDVAVYVKNYLVRADGLDIPYGPVNLEALINDDEQWNFGVNAIEFSAFPHGGDKKFTKFYNFAGDGNLTNDVSGTQQHRVDLDRRGDKPMPTTCIVCHGGRGETLVYRAADGRLKVAPSLVGGIAGDVQAQLQTIEFDTLQFGDVPGFTADENKNGIRLINEAILSAYEHRKQEFTGHGDWKADLAIEILSGRYAGDDYRDFVPAEWLNNQDLYRSLMGPNCMVCHALRGTRANDSGAFPTASGFLSYAARVEHLIFEQGKMPLGLLNYSDFWGESVGSNKDPATMATALGLTNRVDANNRAIRPGAPVAVIAAPPIATGFDASGAPVDIAITGSGSAFATTMGYRWTAIPENPDSTATVTGIAGPAVLRVSDAGNYTLSLTVDGKNGGSDTDTVTVEVRSANDGGTPGAEITYFGTDGINDLLSASGCVGCHAPTGTNQTYSKLPVHFVACRRSEYDDNEFLYRSVLARVNFDSPLDSIFLRKPSNGATDPFNRAGTVISRYHAGGNLFQDTETGNAGYSKILSWILNGAASGVIPPASEIDTNAAACAALPQ
ncbi:MAG: mono/diheme cytochrome c family protein [Granulosicoccus sp.]|jgi:mono/diheme cytochrome c family protein